MKYGLVAWVALAGCFPPEPRAPSPPTHVAAPTVLRSTALKVGQWARYEVRDHWNKQTSTMQLAVVAAGPCGLWVSAKLETHSWMLCIRDDGSADLNAQVARALIDDGTRHPVSVTNAGALGPELDAVIARVIPPTLAGTYGREDAWVPAGHFEQTLVAKAGDATTWLHPAVPFGGVVRIDDGHGKETLLAEYGDSGDRVEQDFLAATHRPATPWGFAELGGGGDWFAGTSHVASNDTAAWRYTFGFVAGRLAPLVSFTGSSSSTTSMSSFGLGLRWHTGLAGLYVQGLAGHASRDVMGTPMDDALTWSTGLGWMIIGINRVGLGVEVDHQLEWVNGGQELTQSASGMAILRLDMGR